jgi:hypothetical protein
VVGPLAVTAVIGLAASGQHSRTIATSDLGQLVKEGQITRIEVRGDSARRPQVTHG